MIGRGFPTSRNPQWGCFEKDQAEALVKYGHKVVAMSVDARFKKHRGRLGMHHFENAGVDYYNYVMLPGIFFSKVTGFDYYMKHIKFHYYDKIYKRVVAEHGTPDIIYSQFFFNTIAGVQLKEKYGRPLIGIEHLGRFNLDNISKENYNGATFAFNGVDRLITVSNSLSRNIKKRYGVDSVVVHNMFGKEFFYKAISDPIQYPIVFVSAASIVYGKGFDVLIKAFAQSKLSKESWKLNIIGWGDERNNLESLVKAKDVQDNVFFLGKMEKEKISEELRKSHVFVLPSRNENFSVAILEGLASGLPVIGTDCGGIRECINEKNGIIVPVDDVDAMAAAIKRMIETYSQYDRDKIAEDCKKRFSPKAIARQLTDVFETVLNKKSNDNKKD